MSTQVPAIEQLQEIALPVPVSYVPQTWGWWVLLALIVATVLLVSARRYWQWRRDRYRREALLRLAQLRSRSSDLNALRELPELLKRVALSMPIRKPVGAGLPAIGVGQAPATLTGRAPSPASRLLQGTGTLGGQDWQAFLEQHLTQPLPADFTQQLAQLAYAPDTTLQAIPSEQRLRLFDLCKLWVERHHVAA